MEDLLATVDQPLKVAICQETKKQYLLCDYNRDGDSFRFFFELILIFFIVHLGVTNMIHLYLMVLYLLLI